MRSGARRRFAAPPPQGARARTLYVPRGGGERGAGRRLLHRVVRQLLAGGRPVVTVRPRSISLSDTPFTQSLTNKRTGPNRRKSSPPSETWASDRSQPSSVWQRPSSHHWVSTFLRTFSGATMVLGHLVLLVGLTTKVSWSEP
jgi:hypothetical protein